MECPFCNKTEETIDRIFINCDLAVNVWGAIDTNRPTHINTDSKTIYWREFLWKNKSWYNKIFGDKKCSLFYGLFRPIEIISSLDTILVVPVLSLNDEKDFS